MSGNNIIMALILICCAGCTVDDKHSAPPESRITAHNQPVANVASIPENRKMGSNNLQPAQRITAAESGPDLVRVQGKIKDSNGEGIGGAAVTLWTRSNDDESSLTWRRIAQAQTSADGSYSIQGRGHDASAITARKDGLAIAGEDDLKPLKDLVGKTANHLDLQLLPGATITGQITTHDGSPVEKAEVLANSDALPAAAIGEFITNTDAAGSFTLTSLPEGKLPLAVAAPERSVQIYESAAPYNNFEMKLADKVSHLDGRLISDDTDLAETTATVSVTFETSVHGLTLSRKIVTGENAAFDFGAVPSSPAMLFVEGNPFGSLILKCHNYTSGRPYHSVDLKDGASSTTLLKVSSGKTIRGFALDVTTSAPVPGVKIFPDSRSVKQDANFVITAADGSFSLPHVSVLHYLQVRAKNAYLYAPNLDELVPHNAADTITLVMKQKPWVRGIVQNRHEAPEAGTKLSWYNLSPISPDATPILLNPDGSFQLTLIPGKYRFFAEAPGCAPAFVDKDLTDSDLNDIKLVLEKGRKISGIVVSPEGKPVAGAVVLSQLGKKGSAGNNPYYPHGDTSFNLPFGKAITDATGRFSFSNAPPDAGIGVIAKSQDYADSPIYFSDPDEGEITDVRLQFPPTGTIRGTVYDKEGKSVAGASLSLFNLKYFKDASESVSSTSGTFELRNVDKSATLIMSINAKSFVDYSNTIQFTDDPLSITLTRQQVRAAIVKSVDIETRLPVPAAITAGQAFGEEIIGIPDSKYPATYLLSPVISGEDYFVTANAEGYATEMHRFTSSVQTDDEWTILLRPTAWVTGRVVNEQGKPLPKARVINRFHSESSVSVEEDGRFEMELKDGYTYLYAETPDGFRSKEIQAETKSGGVTDVGDITVLGEKDIAVRVLKGYDKPATNVQVRVTQAEQEMLKGKTDRNGELKFPRHPAKSYTVDLPEYNVSKRLSSIESNGSVDDLVILHIGSGEFRGKLLSNGKVVPGIVTGSNISASSEVVSQAVLGDGAFHIKDLAPGQWAFSGSQPNSMFDRTTIYITVKDGEVVERDIEVSDKIEIRGIVVDEEDKPVSNVRVSYTAPNGNGGAETDANGQFTISQLINGLYKLSAEQLPGKRSSTVSLAIEDTEPPPVRLVLKRGTGKVRCTALSILDSYPIPAARAELTSIDGNLKIQSGGNSADGEVVVDSIPIGRYQLVVTAYGYSRAERTIEVAEGEPAHYSEVLTPAASLTVTVVSSNGYLAENVSVTVTPIDAGPAATPLSGVTNEKGNVEFPAVESGSYQVQASGTAGSSSATVSTRHQRLVSIRLFLSGNQ